MYRLFLRYSIKLLMQQFIFFLNESSASGFYRLVNTWWPISNSKSQYSLLNFLGNTVVPEDIEDFFLKSSSKAGQRLEKRSNFKIWTLLFDQSESLFIFETLVMSHFLKWRCSFWRSWFCEKIKVSKQLPGERWPAIKRNK